MPNAEIYRPIHSYSDLICKSQFGKRPDSTEIHANERCCVIFYHGLAEENDSRLPDDPDERYAHIHILLEQFIFLALKPKIESLSGKKIGYAFMDWKIESNTSMIAAFFVSGHGPLQEDLYEGKAELHRHVESVTAGVQKAPVEIESFRLGDDLLMIVRTGLLISLEKRLVKKGFNTQLRIAKRELELDRFLEELPLRKLLRRESEAAYLDWAFDSDVSLLTLKLGDEVDPGDASADGILNQ